MEVNPVGAVSRSCRLGHPGGGKPTVDFLLSLLNDNRVMIVAKSSADLGELAERLAIYDDPDYVVGLLCTACARKLLLPIIDRPFGLHREGGAEMVVLNSITERRALLDSLIVHVH